MSISDLKRQLPFSYKEDEIVKNMQNRIEVYKNVTILSIITILYNIIDYNQCI